MMKIDRQKKVWISLLSLGVVFSGKASLAQELGEPIVTDRPDFTESAETVPRGRVQVEAGFTSERAGDEKSDAYGEVLVRLATGDRTELRLGLPSYLRVRGGGESIRGWDDIYLGGKLVLRAGQGRSPKVALLAGTTLPTGSRHVAERKWQPELVAAASVDLSEKTSLATNFGYARASSDGTRFNQFFGSLALGQQLSEKWSGYMEVYGFNRTDAGGPSQRYINGGFTYLMNSDFQLDARLGRGLGNDVAGRDWFYGFGASRRF